MACKVFVALCLLLIAVPRASAFGQHAAANANPIRRVVSMLQAMQTKLAAEAAKETAMFEKFMCYCKTSGGSLQADIQGSTAKIPQVESAIKEAESSKVQLQQDVKDAQASRAEAKATVAEATALRAKEAATHAEESSELTSNIGAMSKAIAALTKGMTGGFLQTNVASVLQRVVADTTDLNEIDRQTLTSFLSGQQGEDDEYVPSSGQVTGILKELKDTMSKSLADTTATEDSAVATFEALMAAKAKEIEACTQAIEDKTVRIGELGVEVAQMKNDLDDTGRALIADKAFLADLEKNCATKDAEWAETTKLRGLEAVAIAETIKILNDDDALELFKKTLPSPSLVQITTSSALVRQRALELVRHARKSGHVNRQPLDLIALALTGKKVDFGAVFKLIDELVETLAKEQQDDDAKKESCEQQLDVTEDKKKELSHAISNLETAIDETTDKISTVSDEIKALGAGIVELDKEVAEQTSMRKDENKDYIELLASDSAAKELLGFAKNRLNKFYNPLLFKAPPKRVLTDEEAIYSSMGGVLEPVPVFIQVHEHRAVENVAPPPAPESPSAYSKKGEESTGVIAMIDLLVADLDKELTEAKTTEKNAQAEYEQFMSDSATDRASKAKSLTDKTGAKASLEGDLETAKEGKTAKGNELMATEEYESSLHAECDWLVSNFELRTTARGGEVDSLKNAKAVLAGADYSLVQRSHSASRALRGA